MPRTVTRYNLFTDAFSRSTFVENVLGVRVARRSPISRHKAFERKIRHSRCNRKVKIVNVTDIRRVTKFTFRPLIIRVVRPVFVYYSKNTFFIRPDRIGTYSDVVITGYKQLFSVPSAGTRSPLLTQNFTNFYPRTSHVTRRRSHRRQLKSRNVHQVLPDPIGIQIVVISRVFRTGPISRPVIRVRIRTEQSSSSPYSLYDSSSDTVVQSRRDTTDSWSYIAAGATLPQSTDFHEDPPA